MYLLEKEKKRKMGWKILAVANMFNMAKNLKSET